MYVIDAFNAEEQLWFWPSVTADYNQQRKRIFTVSAPVFTLKFHVKRKIYVSTRITI